MSVVEEVRKVLQDFLAPELREIATNLKSLTEGQKVLAEGQRDMEIRLLREIQKSEEKILSMLKMSEMTDKLEHLTRENTELKREKTQ